MLKNNIENTNQTSKISILKNQFQTLFENLNEKASTVRNSIVKAITRLKEEFETVNKLDKSEKNIITIRAMLAFIFLHLTVAVDAKENRSKINDAMNSDLSPKTTIFQDNGTGIMGNTFVLVEDKISQNDDGSNLDLPPDPTDIESAVSIINTIPDVVPVEQGAEFILNLQEALPMNIQAEIYFPGVNDAQFIENNSKIKYFADKNLNNSYNYFITITDTTTGESQQFEKQIYIIKGDPVVDTSFPEDNIDTANIGELMNYGANFKYNVDTLQTKFTYFKTNETASGTSWNTNGYENNTTPVVDKNYYGEDVVTVWNTKENGVKSDTTLKFQVIPPDTIPFTYKKNMTSFSDTLYFNLAVPGGEYVDKNNNPINNQPSIKLLGDFSNFDVELKTNERLVKEYGPLYFDRFTILKPEDMSQDFNTEILNHIDTSNIMVITKNTNLSDTADYSTYNDTINYVLIFRNNQSPTNIDEQASKAEIGIYPTPAPGGRATISIRSLESNAPIEIGVYDQALNKINEIILDNVNGEIKKEIIFPRTGMYFIYVKQNNKVLAIKKALSTN